MSQILKSFMGIFLLLFLVMTSAGILSAFLQVLYAQDLHAQIITELEDSDYATVVIKENLMEAKEKGYQMEVILYDEEENYRKITREEELPKDCGDIAFARVHLTFWFQIPFLKINQKHTLRGYAR